MIAFDRCTVSKYCKNIPFFYAYYEEKIDNV